MFTSLVPHPRIFLLQFFPGGTRATPSGDSWGLYFAGRYVFDAVIHQLVEKHGLGSAEAIILSGDSAGGIGTWYHLDRLAERFPKARVVGAPVAGFYFPVRVNYCFLSHGARLSRLLITRLFCRVITA